MKSCPNKNLSSWKNLVNALGNERLAMISYIRNDDTIPNIAEAMVLLELKELPSKEFKTDLIYLNQQEKTAQQQADEFNSTIGHRAVTEDVFYSKRVLQGFTKIYSKQYPRLSFYPSRDGNSAVIRARVKNEFLSVEEVNEELKEKKKELSKKITKEQKEQLKGKLLNFLAKLGISYSDVPKILNDDSVVGMASIFSKIIQVVESKASLDVLPEEVAHFFVELLGKDSPLYKSMYNEITRYKIYKATLDTYSSRKEYQNEDGSVNLDKIKKEAIGKLIAYHILKQEVGLDFNEDGLDENETFASRIIRWFNKLWLKIKSKFNSELRDYFKNEVENPFIQATSKILESDSTGLSFSNVSDDIFLNASTLEDNAEKQQKTLNDIVENQKLFTTDSNGVNYYNGKPIDKVNLRNDSVASTKIYRAVTNIINHLANGFPLDKLIIDGNEEIFNNLFNKIKEELFDNPIYENAKYLTDVKFVNKNTNDKSQLAEIQAVIILADGTIDIKSVEGISEKQVIREEIEGVKYYTTEIEFNVFKALKSNLSGATAFFKNNLGIKVRDIRISPIALKLGEQRRPIKSEYGISALKLDGIIYYKRRGSYYKDINGIQYDSSKEEYNYVDFNNPEKYSLPQEIKGIIDKDLEKIEANTTKESFNEKISKEVIENSKELEDLLAKLFENKTKFVDSKFNKAKTKADTSLSEEEQLNINSKTNEKRRTLEERLERAINELFVKNEVNKLFLYIEQESKEIKSQIEKGGLSQTDIAYLSHQIKLCEDIISYLQNNRKDKITNEIEEILEKALYELSGLKNDLSKINVELLSEEFEERGLDFERPDRQMNAADVSFYSARAATGNKFMQFLLGLFDKVNRKSRQATDIIITELSEMKDKYSGVDVKRILKSDKQSFLAKYNKEFYDKLRLAVNTRNSTWIKDNVVIKENAQEKFESYKKRALENSENVDIKESDINRKMNLWGEYTNAAHIEQAKRLLEGDFSYLKISDKWLSKEYTALSSQEKELYEYFVELNSKLLKMLGANKSSTFLFKVQKTLVEQFTLSDASVLDRLQSLWDGLKVDDENHGQFEQISALTGEQVYHLPQPFLKPLDNPNLQSTDLFKIYAMVAFAANKYGKKAEIDDLIINTREALLNEKLVVKINGKLSVENVNMTNNIKAFDNLVAQGQYGVDIKNMTTKQAKLFKYILDYFTKKALSFNILSPLANTIGGHANAMIEGSKGKNFSKLQWGNSISLITRRDDKAALALKIFDITAEKYFWKKGNKLSLSTAQQYLTSDKWLYMMEKTELWLDNLTLLSMLQNFTIENYGTDEAKIVRKANKEDKSILDFIEINGDNGGLNLSEEAIEDFRNRVFSQINVIKGTSSQEQYQAARMYVLGRLMFNFRGWLPNMAAARWARFDYDYVNKEYKWGRHLMAFDSLWQSRGAVLISNLKEMIPFLLDEETVKNRAKELYLLKKDMFNGVKGYDLTEEQYTEMYLAAVKANIQEFRYWLALGALLLVMGGGDDNDDKDPRLKAIMTVINRAYLETSFFINPNSALQILKSPVPSISFLTSGYSLVSESVGQLVGFLTDNEKKQKNNKPTKHLKKLLISVNGLDNTFEMLAPFIGVEYKNDNN